MKQDRKKTTEVRSALVCYAKFSMSIAIFLAFIDVNARASASTIGDEFNHPNALHP